MSEREENMLARIGELERRERELAEALLGYLRSDIAVLWMQSALRLEDVLESMVK